MENVDGLYLLRASTVDVAGVGCFVTQELAEGTRLVAPDQAPNRKLTAESIPGSHLKYCPLLESGLFLAPNSFATMSVMWYINHSRDPNVVQYRWQLYTARDIKLGEELFLYYPDLLTHPKNKDWVIPELHV